MTTNQRLRQLKEEHGLTNEQIAELTSSGWRVVYAWLTDGDNARNMPAAKLELLEMKLAAQAARGK